MFGHKYRIVLTNSVGVVVRQGDDLLRPFKWVCSRLVENCLDKLDDCLANSREWFRKLSVCFASRR